MCKDFAIKSPCKDCPYRVDAPLRKWDIEEFQDLLRNDLTHMGSYYGCHKGNGHVCVGWLMDQDKRGLPSIKLRLALSRNNVTRKYLDALRCKSLLFDSIKEMAEANYPGINKK